MECYYYFTPGGFFYCRRFISLAQIQAPIGPNIETRPDESKVKNNNVDDFHFIPHSNFVFLSRTTFRLEKGHQLKKEERLIPLSGCNQNK